MYTPLDQAALTLRRADALLITAGAGMGVDSGLPDFRGPQGFWKAYPPYRHLGLNFAQVANPHWFDADPPLAWGFYGHRLHLYRDTMPHAGFEILRRWQTRMSAGTRIFTSNVDGQFQKAGFDPNHIMEAHGSIHHLQCTACPAPIWDAAGIQVTVDPQTFRATGPLPKCPRCGRIARPNILMFGDSRWYSNRTDAQENALDQWFHQLSGKTLVIVECGAGSAVPTVRRFSERIAALFAATLIRINVRESEVTPGHIALPMGAAEALTKIDALL
jgi:NAD-dependent SIR2 family protein deacetylase